MPKCGRFLLIPAVGLFALLSAAVPAAQSGVADQQSHSMAEHSASTNSDQHSEEVNRRGDMAMGFSHEKATHHFRLTSSGGSIEVQANDAKDAGSRDQIRAHLQHIAKMFKSGDFSSPMETHGRVPPGVPAMQDLKGDITYKYEETARGGKVLIRTANPEALKAIHEFLRFQIQDHKTGDAQSVPK